MDVGSGDEARAADGAPALRTFLIADIRGYTAFTREHGDASAARLAKRFADLARDSVEARSGAVLELRGDEALAVFDSSSQAVRAAVELQAACAEAITDDPTLPLPVGIGIDAGEAVPVEDGYRGVALNMAARLCSRAGAGQVLATRRIAELAGDLSGIRFEDRGSVELKGFDHPVELLEVVPDEPPALVTAEEPEPERVAEALPAELEPITPMVDREHEMRWMRGSWRQARRGAGRMVFVTGPTGIGKTRLMAELAAEVSVGGGIVRYAGAGGAGTALAISAVDDAASSRTPTLLVVNDLEALGEPVAEALGRAFDTIHERPVLLVGAFRDAEGLPGLAALVERADARGDGHRRLSTLGAAGVAEIARLYLGPDLEGVPLESMLRASGGVPGRVHEVVADWARDEANRRLSAAAEWLAAGRTQRAADLEFANNAIALRLGRLYGQDGDVLRDGICPFKGLASFGVEDAAYFFGRERLVGELAARTVGAGLLGVVGPSGSGKSSVVLAGVVPSLAAGLLPGSERWRHGSVRPGEHPMRELQSALVSSGFPVDGAHDPLQAALQHLDRDGRLLLVVDQFEELFTTTTEGAERDAFVQSLVRAATEEADRAIVVVTIRGDFYGHCAAHPQLAELLGANHVLVGPMGTEELRRAIELPARRVGLRVESTLTDALVAEVEDEPGGLPLLSTALVELWHLRRDGWLRMESHERTGGVRGAVARLAEASFNQLEGEQRDACRAILLRLVGQGEGDTAVRRRVPVDEFDRTAPVDAVLGRFTEDRLITASDGVVEVAHEALIREWPRLRDWLQEDVQGRQIRGHITQASRQWAERDRDAAELYRGARLSATLDWAAGHGRELNELEREFLSASREAGELEAQRQRRTNRRLRGLLAGVAVFLVVALVAGGLALVQRGKARRSAAEARESATVALAKSLGAQAVVEPRLDTAMLLARESVELAVNGQTRSTFLSTLLRSPAAIGALFGDGNRPLQVSLSPDQRTLAIAENTGTILFRDTRTGTSAHPPIEGVDIPGMRFAPDGSILIARRDRQFRLATIEAVDPSTGRVVKTLAIPKGPSSDPSLEPVGSDFSADGRRLVVAFANRDDASATSYVVQWDFGRAALAGPVISLPRGRLLTVGYASGERRIVAVGTKAWILGAGSGRHLESFEVAPAHSAAVSPTGGTVVLGYQDGSVTFLDMGSGHRTQGIGGHSASVQSAGFTPDGKTAITTGDDRMVLLWEVAAHTEKETFSGHGGRVLAQAVSADGRTLYTASLDGTVLLWYLAGDRRFGRSFQAGASEDGPFAATPHVAVSPDGGELAVGDAEGTVNLWDLRSLRRIDGWQAIPGQVENLEFSPDGQSILVTGSAPGPDFSTRGFLRIERVTGSHETVVDFHPPFPVSWSTFGPGGKTVASSVFVFHPDRPNTGGWAVWDGSTGRLLTKRTDFPAGVLQVAFSPSGTRLAVVMEDQRGERLLGKAAIIDVPGGRVERIFEVGTLSPPLAVDFSPDGTMFATGAWDGHVQFWDVDSGAEIGRAVKASDGAVVSVRFAPDGRQVVAGGSDGTTRLFDVATRRQIGSAFPGQDNVWEFADFTPDGSSIVVNYSTGRTYVWPATIEGWARHACEVSHRNFTRAEWTQFVPGYPYRRVCPDVSSP
jgi:WD40 repeat protein/class 3 adenylate cyclase